MKKRALRELYSTIRCISRRAEREGEEGSYEGHLSFMEGYKNRLVTCLRKKQNPFEKFKDLKEEDMERFIAKCESPEFVANNKYMR
jgi:hypothetical protein